MVADIQKKREDAKLNKGVILRQGLSNYGMYGAKNPFTNILTEEELKNLKPEMLTDKIKSLESYDHRILYYGSKNADELKATLENLHNVSTPLKPLPAATEFKEQETGNNVFVIDYDMKQAEIIMMNYQHCLSRH